jgi:hypothetical protein
MHVLSNSTRQGVALNTTKGAFSKEDVEAFNKLLAKVWQNRFSVDLVQKGPGSRPPIMTGSSNLTASRRHSVIQSIGLPASHAKNGVGSNKMFTQSTTARPGVMQVVGTESTLMSSLSASGPHLGASSLWSDRHMPIIQHVAHEAMPIHEGSVRDQNLARSMSSQPDTGQAAEAEYALNNVNKSLVDWMFAPSGMVQAVETSNYRITLAESVWSTPLLPVCLALGSCLCVAIVFALFVHEPLEVEAPVGDSDSHEEFQKESSYRKQACDNSSSALPSIPTSASRLGRIADKFMRPREDGWRAQRRLRAVSENSEEDTLNRSGSSTGRELRTSSRTSHERALSPCPERAGSKEAIESARPPKKSARSGNRTSN